MCGTRVDVAFSVGFYGKCVRIRYCQGHKSIQLFLGSNNLEILLCSKKSSGRDSITVNSFHQRKIIFRVS